MNGDAKRVSLVRDFTILGVALATVMVVLSRDEIARMDLGTIYAISTVTAIASVAVIGLAAPVQLWSSGFFYIVMIAAFHIGIPIVTTFGWAVPQDATAYTNLWLLDSSILRTTLVLCIICMLTFTLGYLPAARRVRRTPRFTDAPVPGFGRVGLLLIAAGAAVYMGYAAIAAPALYLGAGKSLYEATIAGSGPVGFGTILVAIGLPMVAAAPKSETRKWALVIFWVFAIFTLVIGSRTGALYAIVGFVVVIARLKPMPRKRVAIAAVVSGLLLVSTVEQIRGPGIGEASVVVGSPSAAIHEMGSTLRPVVETVGKVDAGEPLRYGATYFTGLVRAFEGVVGVERPEPDLRWASSVVSNRTDGYQIGYSAIAESYLNFGTFGSGIVFLGLGLLFGRMDSRNLGSPVSAARVGLVFIVLASVVRQSSNIMLTTLLLGLVAIEFARRVGRVRARTAQLAARR